MFCFTSGPQRLGFLTARRRRRSRQDDVRGGAGEGGWPETEMVIWLVFTW
jgi:hypothetical protein